MAPIGTLWGKPHQPQTKVIRSVAALNELELNQPEYHFMNRASEYTSKFGYGKIPAFEDADGFKLTEGATIARYVCGLGTKVNLLGADAKETAQIDQWLHFAENEIGKWSYNHMCVIYGIYGVFDQQLLNAQIERLKRSLAYVEAHLATCPSGYLVGDSVTLADLFLAALVYDASLLALGEAERASYPLVYAHYAKVTGDARVKAIWEDVQFTEVTVAEQRPFPYT